jgi:CDP-diacylglycerol--serine O-phosphatidyltransferase
MNYKRMVPNSISGLSMVLGVLSIFLTMDHQFSRAAIFIILAVCADSCDGRAARLLGVSGDFGKEMDSICDVCSFGMAPAILIYTYAMTELGLAGQIIASLFTFGAGLRLARFNVNTGVVHGYFQGMPAPAGACVIVTYVLSGFQFGAVGTAILTLAVAKLMYSDVRYPDFKGHGNPLYKLPVIVSFVIGAFMLLKNFSAWPFVIMFTYTLCGVLNAIYVKATGKNKETEA